MKYIPNTPEIEKKILEFLGKKDFQELVGNIPKKFLEKCKIKLPEPMSDIDINKHMFELAGKNKNTSENISFLGGGAYDHHIPAVVDYLLSRSEFYTAYTPYQPEVSQGTLQAIYEYQSMICQLMDMEIGNASMYDGATALAEAAILSVGVNRKNKVLVSPLINPTSLEVLQTYLSNRDIEIEMLAEENGRTLFENLDSKFSESAALLVQSPNFLGNIEELGVLKNQIQNHKTHFIISTDPISLGTLKTPGELGADIAVAEGQPLGIHQSFGGPYLGIFTAKKSLARKMPGRIVGETEDVDGKRGYVLILQTREQHIRRERATSNICSNQALMALAATIYLALVGKQGMEKISNLCLNNAHYLAENINKLSNFELAYPGVPFFKEFVVKTKIDPQKIINVCLKEKIFAGINLGEYRKEWKNHLLIAVTEKRDQKEMDLFINVLSKL